MKHITEQYGSKTNLIQSTYEEFNIIKDFLHQLNVECRLVLVDGSENTCLFQARNTFEHVCYDKFIIDNDKMEKLQKNCKEEIKKGMYGR